MIFGRSKIFFTKFNLFNSVKCVCLNQTWLASNALQAKVLPHICSIPRRLNTHTEVKISLERLETSNQKLSDKGKEQLLKSNVQSLETVEELLKMINKQNLTSLPLSNVILILNRLLDLRAQNKTKLTKKNLMNTPAFSKLILILETGIQKTEDVNDLWNIFFFCKTFQLPYKLLDIDKVTIKINKKIDELNFHQKLFLYKHYFSDSDISSDTKSELEFLILLEAKEKLKSYLIEDKVEVLSKSLMFPMPNEMKVEILKLMLDLGRENWCQYDIAYSFLNLLSYVHKDFPEFEFIQNRLLDILQECVNDSEFIRTVPKFISTFVFMVAYRKLEYRSHLFNCILDNVVKYNLSFDDKMIICDALNVFKFNHAGFIENLVETAIKDPDVLNEQQLFTLTKTVTDCGSYFRKMEWESLFTSRKDLTNWDNEKKLFAYSVICAGAGLFDNEVFELLSKKFTKEDILVKKGESCLTVLLMNHALLAWNPTYVGPFLSEEIRLLLIEHAQKNLEPVYIFWAERIKELIESAVGIKDCVLTCCWSKHGEIIDQVMALNQNGEPLSLAHIKKTGGILYIEDICLPKDYKLVLIANFHRPPRVAKDFFCLGRHILKFNVLKELGHPLIVCVFDYELGEKLSLSEKGQCVWKQIKEKFIFLNNQPTSKISLDEPVLLPYNPDPFLLDDKKIDFVITDDENNWSCNALSAIDGHVWYTDGSKKDSGIGSGVYCPERELEISNYLDVEGTSSEAEIESIAVCAQEAYAYVENGNFNNVKTVVNILTDSRLSISYLSNYMPMSTERIMKCRKILKRLSEKAHVRIIWVPGHSGVKGNVKADSLAKMGASGIQFLNEKIIGGER